VDLLEINAQNFETDFENHWGINSDQAPGDVSFEDRILARKLDAVGREILTTVHAIALTPTIANALREFDPAQTWWQASGTAARTTSWGTGVDLHGGS
jgi:hypothetical protein